MLAFGRDGGRDRVGSDRQLSMGPLHLGPRVGVVRLHLHTGSVVTRAEYGAGSGQGAGAEAATGGGGRSKRANGGSKPE
eukprot:scaffold40300_cov270-Isochrysis_galbana.AAC.3